MRRFLWLFLLVPLLVGARDCKPPVPPIPTPTPPVNTCADNPNLCNDDSVCVDTPMGPVCEPKPTPPPTCPETCPEGQVCEDPAVGCKPIDCRVTTCPPGQHCVPGQGCVPDPPPPTACINGPALTTTPCDGPQHLADVKRATDELGDLTGQECNANLLKLRDKLLSYGLCAIGGEPGSEAVFIRRADGLVEENHACNYASGAWTNSGNGRFMGCHTDNVIPPGIACSDPIPPKPAFCRLTKHNLLIDATCKFSNKQTATWDGGSITGYCVQAGMPGQDNCPARGECPNFKCVERQACEKFGMSGKPDGMPVWRSDGVVKLTENPFQVRVKDATWVEICTADISGCWRLTL